jgi:uncharacterized protein YgbK (DUF1537 family)
MPLRQNRILTIADDMTGALEVGSKLCNLGSLVTTGPDLAFSRQHNAIVMDTETRHLSSAEAGEKVCRIAKAARRLRVEVVYKKTDSTLRGNIGSEVHALARAYPERPIVFLPAYPRLGRTVRHGHLRVDGELVHRTAFAHDALNPVQTSYVPEVLDHGELSIHVMETAMAERLESSHVYVFDSETDADMYSVIRQAFAARPLPLFCGPGSVSRHLAIALGCSDMGCSDAPVKMPAVTSVLVVNGSRHERSEEQIQHARDRGWPSLSAAELLRSTTQSEWTILDAHVPADRMGEIVAEVLAVRRVDCLVIFGGDTAFSILRALGASTVIPVGELFPGIPVSRLGELQLVTKAGGFGPPDVLSNIREILSRGR